MAEPDPVQREISSSVFDEPCDKSDVALVVEGRSLHVNKAVLATASDFFDTMFNGNFKEKQEREVPLPGKRYTDIVDMLLCIYPSELRPVTKATVDKMLELADEYQIKSLKRKCEEFLLRVCKMSKKEKKDVTHALYLADKYSMPNVLKVTIHIVKQYKFRDAGLCDFCLEQEQDFLNLGNETKLNLMAERIAYLE
ncbi:BTB and MATH domain-containing protein 36-like isoform X2 [Haliotis rubra]|uniref:BTB and MATH domain-containing protein 36-like isoform X2 n=1 Tax=Haliotis rubra TaxID=36100 RepID=UPI001EE54381|nr:BTB and MATH domain-containing protein 36-like isoform X2 [Haliotis rubra]